MSALDSTVRSDGGFAATLELQRKFFREGVTRPLRFRDRQLEYLEKILLNNEREIFEALRSDLGKPPFETFLSEIGTVIKEIRYARKNLKKWLKRRRVSTPLLLFPASSYIYREPIGVALIIGAWNYPLQLTLSPLVGAIAAGCCAIIKPSEMAPQTSKLLHRLLTTAYPKDYITVIEGGVAETTALLELKFDHIFFTGSTQVGRVIATAAAKTLTPVTLELGGKSPAIVCADADIDLAARRIVWGRYLNGGQSCVAPDYIYAHETVAERFLERARFYVTKFYGVNPEKSPDFARVINEKNFNRLEQMLINGKVEAGGQRDRATKFIAPTILSDVDWSSASMQDEIFGPILPVLKYSSFDDVIEKLKTVEKPLAAYIFTDNDAAKNRFIDELPFGGGTINDVVAHFGSSTLPFGGVGASGYGSYHGEQSFLTFTHQKSVLKKSKRLDVPFRYPPYKAWKLKLLRFMFLGRF